MQSIGLLQGDNAPLGFGTNNFAVICDKQNQLLKNIWVTGHTITPDDIEKLTDALLSFGQSYNFLAVNWFQARYYNLVERQSVEEFVKTSC